MLLVYILTNLTRVIYVHYSFRKCLPKSFGPRPFSKLLLFCRSSCHILRGLPWPTCPHAFALCIWCIFLSSLICSKCPIIWAFFFQHLSRHLLQATALSCYCIPNSITQFTLLRNSVTVHKEVQYFTHTFSHSYSLLYIYFKSSLSWKYDTFILNAYISLFKTFIFLITKIFIFLAFKIDWLYRRASVLNTHSFHIDID